MEEHMSDNKIPSIIAVAVTCAVAAYIAVILRFVSRHLLHAQFKADDWFIVAGLVRRRYLYQTPIANMLADIVHGLQHRIRAGHRLRRGKAFDTGQQSQISHLSKSLPSIRSWIMLFETVLIMVRVSWQLNACGVSPLSLSSFRFSSCTTASSHNAGSSAA